MSSSESKSLGVAGLAIGFILATGLFYLIHRCKFDHDDLSKYHTYDMVTGDKGSYLFNKSTGDTYFVYAEHKEKVLTKQERENFEKVKQLTKELESSNYDFLGIKEQPSPEKPSSASH